MTVSPHRRTTHISNPSTVAAAGPSPSGTFPSARPPSQTRVQFHDDVRFPDDEAKSGVLVACETSHPGGVIAPLVRRISDLKLEVHNLESRLTQGMRSERLWVTSPDGKPLSPDRQGQLRTAVFRALEAVNIASGSDAAELTA